MRFALSILIPFVLATGVAIAQPATDRALRVTVGSNDALAQRFWPDILAESKRSTYDPSILITEATDRYGRRVTFTQIQSDSTCGAQFCASRLYIDGNLEREFTTCGNAANIKLSADATYIDACGQRIDIPAKLP